MLTDFYLLLVTTATVNSSKLLKRVLATIGLSFLLSWKNIHTNGTFSDVSGKEICVMFPCTPPFPPKILWVS